MSCNWCSYELSLVYPCFKGYTIFNSYGDNLGYNLCSMNCCLSQIYKIGVQTNQYVDQLYKFYNLKGFIPEAKPKNKLSKFGGTLSYTQYREEFICPPPDYEEEFVENDYEFEDDPYKINSEYEDYDGCGYYE